jgi:hypothetical protein
MARTLMYAEPTENLTVNIPGSIKEAIKNEAWGKRMSASQLVTVILEEWLRERVSA